MRRSPMPRRTKPLKATTELKRTEMPRGRTRMKAVSDRRRKRDRAYPASRTAVYDRAGGMCEVRAAGCAGGGHQVHHIAGRGGPDPHRLDNLLLACSPCHGLIHANPGWAYEHGFMRSRLATNEDDSGSLSHDVTSPSSAMDTGGIRGGGA